MPPSFLHQHPPTGGPLALAELSGLYRAPESTPDRPSLTSVDVEVAEDGSWRIMRVAVGPWAGLALPRAGFVVSRDHARASSPQERREPPSLRIKGLLDDQSGPARGWDETAQWVLKVGDTLVSSWTELESLLRRAAPQLRPDGEVVVDGRAALPARYVLAPLALALAAEVPVALAMRERSDAQADALRDELAAATSDADQDTETGLPAVGVRLYVDGRAPWGAVLDVLDAVAANRIPRVTFAVVVEGARVDLQPVRTDAAGRTVGLREPRFLQDPVHKPVIVLEDELDGGH